MGDWKALAQAAIGRRVELGHHSREAFAKASGISIRTLGDIESARRESYAPETLVRLEKSLQWPPGAVPAVLDGGKVVEGVIQHEQHAVEILFSADGRAARATPSDPADDRVLHFDGELPQDLDYLRQIAAEHFARQAADADVTPVETVFAGVKPSFTLDPAIAAKTRLTDQALRLSWLTGPYGELSPRAAAKVAAAVEAVIGLTLPYGGGKSDVARLAEAVQAVVALAMSTAAPHPDTFAVDAVPSLNPSTPRDGLGHEADSLRAALRAMGTSDASRSGPSRP